MATTPSRRSGKTDEMEKMRDDYLRTNPKATIVTVRGGETIVEKQVEEVGPKLIGADYRTAPGVSTEVEGRIGPDGTVHVTAIHSWSHELDIKAEPEEPSADGQPASG